MRVWTVETYNFRAATQEYAMIIAAMEARDTEAAVGALKRHLAHSRDDLAARFA